MEPSDPISIIFFIVAAISIAGTLYVSYHFYEKSKHTINAALLFYLNATITVECVISLPFVFAGNNHLCKFAGWLHAYFALGNMTATLLLTLYYVNNVYATDYVISRFIQRWKTVLTFVFPLITAFAFLGNGYGHDHQQWCSIILDSRQAFDWGIAVFYVWIWMAMIICIILVTKVLIAMRKLNGNGRDAFSTVGFFVYVAVALWVPRTFRKFYVWITGKEFSELDYALMTLPLYVAGILYTIIFLYDKSVLDIEDIQFETSSLSITGFDFDWSEILPSFSMNPGVSRESGIRMTDSSFATRSIINPIVRNENFSNEKL